MGAASTPVSARTGPPTGRTQPVMFFVDVAYRATRPGSLVATDLLEHIGKLGITCVEHLPAARVGDLLERLGGGFTEQDAEDAQGAGFRWQGAEVTQERVGRQPGVVLAVGEQHDRDVRAGIRPGLAL